MRCFRREALKFRRFCRQSPFPSQLYFDAPAVETSPVAVFQVGAIPVRHGFCDNAIPSVSNYHLGTENCHPIIPFCCAFRFRVLQPCPPIQTPPWAPVAVSSSPRHERLRIPAVAPTPRPSLHSPPRPPLGERPTAAARNPVPLYSGAAGCISLSR